MAIKRCLAEIDVVAAAEQRIKNVFNNGVPVYMSFSGGKDSLSLAQVVINLIQRGDIRAEQLSVHFIDEEGIYPCIEKTVINWRRKFMALGAAFEWYCIEIRHYSCFNELTEDETYICWDSEKEGSWVRRPPSFAIRNHPLLKPRKDMYQDFLPRLCMDGITMTGIRANESIQRRKNIASMITTGNNMTGKRQVFPIYDWTNNDVWKYLYEQGVEIPDVYLYLWQSGTSKSQLRISQFFTIDSAKCLVQMNEYYPDLMDSVIRREPNAYLAAMYWDSEMFGRRTRKRRDLEGQVEKDYKALLIDLFSDMRGNFRTPLQHKVATRYRNFFMGISAFADNRDFREIYDGLTRGDPKLRTYRALYNRVYGRYITAAKREESGVRS
jgi:predicted phosphoadenosine phosphosulfate sulfurtransferase